jgi:predicted P-loop ATPase
LDEVERIDTLLIDYLGAEDSPNIRAVTRKALIAAVARIYEPGIKFDLYQS